jgi:hypothetical protein
MPAPNAAEFFYPPKGPRAAKLLLAAAIKAREQADGAERAAKAEAENGD